MTPVANNRGAVIKIPNHPKASSTNQGKNRIVEENINKLSSKTNNCMIENFICKLFRLIVSNLQQGVFLHYFINNPLVCQCQFSTYKPSAYS